MTTSLKEKTLSLLYEKGDKVDQKGRQTSRSSPPPSYQAEDPADVGLSAQIRRLNLGSSTVDSNTVPSNDECIAHLKLLAAFVQLREEVSETDGVLGLNDSLAERCESIPYSATGKGYKTNSSRSSQPPPVAKIREKRWAVYVTRAVDRFQKWWETLLPGRGREVLLQMKDCLTPQRLETMLRKEMPMRWRLEMLPPLDVLMVLHSFMLNPRGFLEDCLRYDMLPLWYAGFPWDLVNTSINDRGFEYCPPDDTVASFTAKTGLSWDNLQDPHTKTITCPNCQKNIKHVYTEGYFGARADKAFEESTGYADKAFAVQCMDCSLVINHQLLCLTKFHLDVRNLLDKDTPMPGTILSVEGIPESAKTSDPTKHEVFFPNRLILAGLHTTLLDVSKADVKAQGQAKVEEIRAAFENGLRERSLVSQANGKTFSKTIKRSEKISMRRLMSKYWENSSPFALDLGGAVLRQGVFVEKMKAIDWIHSPALENTMSRLIAKYINFFKIIGLNPGRVAVPTLDVDLAWHTHQLSPNAYFMYSIAHANGQFVDHDDKIDENALSNSFEWTSRQYQKMTGGEVYSECTCWYCEAIREAANGRNLFGSSKYNSKALSLHDRKDINHDPNKNPHISAHNAVKANSLAAERIAMHQAMKLDADYLRAVKRAQKAGKHPPDRGAYTTAYVWGYPMYMPFYMPYAADPGVSTGMYPCNPACMTVNPGAAGNCVSGACGGGVGAGSCAGGAAGGACAAGSSAGGCGGGGGGGGGCGGGGGGGGGCGGGGGA